MMIKSNSLQAENLRDVIPGGAAVVDSENNRYVFDSASTVIRKYSPAGQQVDLFRVIGRKPMRCATLSIDCEDALYVRDLETGNVLTFDTDGVLLGEYQPETTEEHLFIVTDIVITGDQQTAVSNEYEEANEALPCALKQPAMSRFFWPVFLIENVFLAVLTTNLLLMQLRVPLL